MGATLKNDRGARDTFYTFYELVIDHKNINQSHSYGVSNINVVVTTVPFVYRQFILYNRKTFIFFAGMGIGKVWKSWLLQVIRR